ncbi:SRPBCC family protein [Pengzhenrongella phosphoraccumulans]|uniref:SRPBCC family protein n=1 Tax=Pengzhenrongella phosphoraccumulans TaxID=3114394 RepID=UPI00388D7B7D
MSERRTVHATFVIERVYGAPPAQVFAAFADPAVKGRWFAGPGDWVRPQWSMDFRVGGREVNRGGPTSGPVHELDAVFQDIVADERIVYTYDLRLDGRRISVSVVTIELWPDGVGTRLVFTEQGAYLDGLDRPEYREQGTAELLDALGVELHRAPAAP